MVESFPWNISAWLCCFRIISEIRSNNEFSLQCIRMHFYCFLIKEIMKWAEIFTGWFYYISHDSCMEAFKDTLSIVCNGFNPFASEAVYTHKFFSTACRTACKHAFCFLRVLPEAVSTRHSWLWQTLDDVYTRRCFSESEGTRFGTPGQKALLSGNEWMEWNEWMDFCLIPLSTTCSVEVPGTNL